MNLCVNNRCREKCYRTKHIQSPFSLITRSKKSRNFGFGIPAHTSSARNVGLCLRNCYVELLDVLLCHKFVKIMTAVELPLQKF